MDVIEQSLRIPADGVGLDAEVVVPRPAQGVVLFAHGSGSGRHSPRNTHVAGELRDAGLATVLLDLLTPAEDRIDSATARLRFDIQLLAGRLTAVCDWLVDHEVTAGLAIGLFGASTGAASALVAAAARPDSVSVIVSRGGRPDLAGSALGSVHQPTLLIVGERDRVVIDLNRRALHELAGEAGLAIVPGATHLFQEPGTLEQVAQLARDWFVRHLRGVVGAHPIPDDDLDIREGS
jgi:putative phosphoribosyl transferase